jgi:hypothetical protein
MKSRAGNVQTIHIGGTAINLPDFLETRVEDDTLVACPPRTYFVILRLTVVTVTKDGQEVADEGQETIREGASEAQAELHESADKVWYHLIQPASEGTPGSLMHYWYVGLGGHTLIVSCFVDAAKSNHPLSGRVLAAVEPAIDSFRRHPD